jgi:hypothetical protein
MWQQNRDALRDVSCIFLGSCGWLTRDCPVLIIAKLLPLTDVPLKAAKYHHRADADAGSHSWCRYESKGVTYSRRLRDRRYVRFRDALCMNQPFYISLSWSLWSFASTLLKERILLSLKGINLRFRWSKGQGWDPFLKAATVKLLFILNTNQKARLLFVN